ncbi:unnamed protein product [Gordionus sp. m RMFG-2023]
MLFPRVLRRFQDKRNISHLFISLPAKNKIPQAEKYVCYLFMSVGILFYPLWVLSNIKEYQRIAKERIG